MLQENKQKTLVAITAGAGCLLIFFMLHLLNFYKETTSITKRLAISHGGPDLKNPTQPITDSLSHIALSDKEETNLLSINPFKISLETPKPVQRNRPTQKPAAPPKQTTSTSHNLKLVGTIYGKTSWAAILDTKQKIEGFYSPGDTIKERIKLLAVTRSSATILFNDAEETLTLEWKKINDTNTETTQTSKAGMPGVETTGWSNGGTTKSIDVSKDELKKNFKNLSHLLSQMRVQAFFEKGKPAGFLISKIRKDSFVHKLGAKKGDIIRSVNGKKVDSVQKAFKLYNSFKNNKQLQLTITRDGAPLNLNFSVK